MRKRINHVEEDLAHEEFRHFNIEGVSSAIHVLQTKEVRWIHAREADGIAVELDTTLPCDNKYCLSSTKKGQDVR
jgi:hypothetical protein